MKKSTLGVYSLVLLGAAAASAVLALSACTSGPRFLYAPVIRGGISREIITSGTLRPQTDVDVGTDVSGKIVNVLVDFNAKVKKGQLLAEIDPVPFEEDIKAKEAALQAAQAALDQARADLGEAKKKYDRAVDQYNHKLISQEDMETAQADYKTSQDTAAEAEADAASARTDLQASRVNLSHTRITSPIGGVVITRAVEVGQTVASRMQTPILFEIADDLTKLVLECDIDEVDVGSVKAGQTIVFTVPAFQDTSFSGTVSEIRELGEDVNGTVAYKTLVLVDNPDLKLLPGMTATVRVFAAALKDVLQVPNTAFRLRPPDDAIVPNAVIPRPDRKRGEAVVWVDAGRGKLAPVLITRGITDLKNTAIAAGDLREGQSVFVGLAPGRK